MELVLSILSGIAVCIPLVIKLINTVKEVVKEKNWNELVSVAFDYMRQAEELFDIGAPAKDLVKPKEISGGGMNIAIEETK